jgi:sterol desaturase/sphingolipid hydroxylase (fatty acid hydroxylase superfamily)
VTEALRAFLENAWAVENPSERFYYPFLLSSLAFYLAFLLRRGLSVKDIGQRLFAGARHRSFHTDLGLFLLNGGLKATLFSSVLGAGILVTWKAQTLLGQIAPGLRSSVPPGPLQVLLFTFFAFALDDFLRFALHAAMHRFPWLWRFHRVHHSATLLNPLTLYRTHPVEVFLSSCRNTLSVGVVAGIGLFLFGAVKPVHTLMGVGAFGFLFNGALANLRHSPVPVRFGWLEHLLISPYLHQIHHSVRREHLDKNFGTSLSIWDRLYGSLLVPRKTEDLAFGLEERKAQPTAEARFALLVRT